MLFNTAEVIIMNIAFFLLPKSKVAYLYEDSTVRQGLEKLRHHGYTEIPVISRQSEYLGSVSEGDILWHLLGKNTELRPLNMNDTENIPLSKLLDTRKNPPVSINCTPKDILEHSCFQSFVPVVDDFNSFIGIVTLSDVMRHYYTGDSDIHCDAILVQSTV